MDDARVDAEILIALRYRAKWAAEDTFELCKQLNVEYKQLLTILTLAQVLDDGVELEDLVEGLEGDGVHAEAAAVVPRLVPVEGHVQPDLQPREVIRFPELGKVNVP